VVLRLRLILYRSCPRRTGQPQIDKLPEQVEPERATPSAGTVDMPDRG
jgi:hypothetical protein